MNLAYNFGQMVFDYFKWHYSRGFNELIEISRDLFRFLIHFFSFKLLLSTLFSPLKRMGEHYEKGLHVEAAISTFIVNSVMRATGFVSRIFIILISTISIIVFMIGAFILSLLWLFMPFILIATLLSASFLIFSYSPL